MRMEEATASRTQGSEKKETAREGGAALVGITTDSRVRQPTNEHLSSLKHFYFGKAGVMAQ